MRVLEYFDSNRKAPGDLPPGPFYGHDGHPRAWLIWDFMKIAFRTVKNRHWKIKLRGDQVT